VIPVSDTSLQNFLVKIEFLETIKALNGRIENLAYHQKRYETVLASYGVADYKDLGDYLSPPQKGLYRCRVVYTLEKIVEVTYHPYTKRSIKHLKALTVNEFEYAKKYADREVLNALYAKREKCDDILIIQKGFVTDTSIANVAFFDGVEWFTPKKPLLAGTTRQRLLDSGFLKLADISINELSSFKAMAVMNAMIDFDIITKKIEEIIC